MIGWVFLTLFLGLIAGMLCRGIEIDTSNLSWMILCILTVVIGVKIGAENKKPDLKKWLSYIKTTVFTIIGSFIGTMSGGVAAAHILNMSMNKAMAVAGGFGWYSLSVIILNNLDGAHLGAVAFLSNILRELMIFVLIPLTAKLKCVEAGISSAGATSMDTALPLVLEYSGTDDATVSFLHGTVLTLVVPVLVPLMYNIF